MAAKRTAKKKKSAKKTVRKALTGARKTIKKATSKRTVRKAADRVQKTAKRAHELGESVTSAGELIQQTADLVGSMAQRAKKRTAKRGR